MEHLQISLQRRVIFLHIAKTAGTSIVEFFRDRLQPDAISSHGDFLRYTGSEREKLARLGEFQFLSGHFGYNDVAPLLEDSFAFTFLRDPIDRVLSLYKFLLWPVAVERIPAARLAVDLGMEGFLTSTLPEVCELLDNQQTWQLARSYWFADRQALSHLPEKELLSMAVEHLNDFDLVGTQETFDKDFGFVIRSLGIQDAVPQERKFKTPKPTKKEALSSDVVACLQERMALDYALLDYVQSKRSSEGS